MPLTQLPVRFLQSREVDLGSTASGTVMVDLSLARDTYIVGTQTGNLTIQFTNASAMARVTADILQGGAGGFTLAFTLSGGTVAFPENQPLNVKTAAGAWNSFAGVCVSATRINANSSRY